MARPAGYQWEPLGLDQDPVPGDTEVISGEARHLMTVARQLEGQVSALHRIADNSENMGKAPDMVRSAASDLSGSLAMAAARYHKVATALSNWVPELAQAQSWSIRALNEAEVPYAKIKNTPAPSGLNLVTGIDGLPQLDPPSSSTWLSPVQLQDYTDYRNAISRAQDELTAARALLNRAMVLRDNKGSYYANQISNACNDGLEARDGRGSRTG